ncbi:MAG: hypothetical protein ACKV19_24100 [Verrucomicrobiales bacterium]
MNRSNSMPVACAFALALQMTDASAGLLPVDIWQGHVGLSIDAIGGNSTPVGEVQAEIPAGATVLAAYLYSAGTPFPWYSDSPTTVAHYNGAGISLGGNAVTNFDTLVGAVSDRADIGRWYTGRADVTSIVQSLHTAGPAYSWEVLEGAALNGRIDGNVLVVVYEDMSLPEASVVLLDGGQDTGGETTVINFDSPLGDPTAADFVAEMSLGISFSCCGQVSEVDINGTRLTSSAGSLDDGTEVSDGSLITAGGIGDDPANPTDPDSSDDSLDDELYTLDSFLSEGDLDFSIFTQNDTNDDNIFMMGLYITADVGSVGPDPVPEGGTSVLLLGLSLLPLAWSSRRKRRTS